MLRKAFVFAACVCVLIVASSCKKKETQLISEEKPKQTEAVRERKAGEPYVMHIGHAQSVESPRHRSLLFFKRQVEKLTAGNVVVEIFPNGVVGDEAQMTKSVSEGALEAVRGGDLEFVPKSMLLGLPMIADTLEDARKLCYSNFVQGMFSVAKEKNMMVLAVGDDSGFRQITNSERPLVKPSDFKGLTIRAPQIPATVNFITELGASAMVVPFTELYAALAVGKVAGQENPLALIDSSKFYEVQKYCTMINYQFFPELMFVNLNWWNELPQRYQSVVRSCANDMMEENGRITDAENESYIKHIEENGCHFTYLTPEQRAAFLPYAERVWRKFIDDGYASKAELKEMLALVGKTVSW
ncbi:MAG: TRAP transporter substrate-binding protein [Treponema sp.]|nr:TRAP transporter substrate-binding protein [Treponema sp.]